jgi:hypothetical protein
MRLVAICPTYRRPKLIPNVLALWEMQDYPEDQRHLVILEDGGSFDSQVGKNWTLLTSPERFPTLGLKFGALCDFAITIMKADGIVVWEDDDVYLPHHLSAAADTLKNNDVSCSSVVLSDDGGKGLHDASAIGRHHGAWSFTSDAYIRSGGYPKESSPPFDFSFLQRLKNAGCSIGDPRKNHKNSYIYRWMTSGYTNGSAFGNQIHERTEKTHTYSYCPGDVIPEIDKLTAEYFQQQGLQFTKD